MNFVPVDSRMSGGCTAHSHPGPDATAFPPTAGCCNSGQPQGFGGDLPLVKPALVDMIFPEVTFPSNRVFKAVGEAKLRALVTRHHQLLRQSPIGHLFPQEETLFSQTVRKIADFVVKVCGGPKIYTPVQGPPRMRARHLPFPIDEQSREIWLQLCIQALKKVDFPKVVLEEYWQWVEPFSIRMINRRLTLDPVKRYPFTVIKAYCGLEAI